MIDIHSHLLPGVDDGSKSVEMSLPVLERFVADGVTCVVLTPHLLASRTTKAPYERNHAIFEELRSVAPRELELRLGWEIMLDEPNVDFRSKTLSLGGGPSCARGVSAPWRLLDGQPLMPVPPLSVSSGVFGHLRSLFLSRR